jgi:hypothetical protein
MVGLRRASAILLLVLFSFSLLSPAFGSGAAANLPACCRRDGKHHCAISPSEDAAKSGAHVLTNGKCPLYPRGFLRCSESNAIELADAALIGPGAAFRLPSHVVHAGFHSSPFRSHRKRGPPRLFISLC